MSDSVKAIGPEVADTQAEPVSMPVEAEKRWPLVFAFVMSWIMPATTARRIGHVGLAKAFGFHVVSAFIFFFSATAAVAFELERSPWRIWGEILQEIRQQPGEFLMLLGIMVAIIEGFAIGLALLLTPWGARDERLRSSLYQAMRCVWLQTMHVAVASMVLIGLLMLYTDLVRDPWFRTIQNSGTNWSDSPWYIHHSDECTFYVCVTLYGWALWGMLRAVAARPVVAPVDCPPTCQSCGYNLKATAPDGVCPECGEPVLASIGPDARAGIGWERGGRSSPRRSWWETTWRAIRTPRQFGRELQVYSPPAGHRRFLLVNMVLGGLMGVLASSFWLAGFMCGYDKYPSVSGLLEDAFWLIGPVNGVVGGTSVLALSLLFAGLAGTLFSFGTGRNLLSACMRCAAYLSGFIVLWAGSNVFIGFLLGGGYANAIWLNAISDLLHLRQDELSILVCVGFNLIWLSVYLRLLQLMLSGARFANR